MNRMRMTLGVVGVSLLLVSPLPAIGPDDNDKPEMPVLPKCAVMDKPIDFAISTSTDEGRVYFCCKRCQGKFESNSSSFAENVTKQREALAKMPKLQVSCPIDGDPIDPTAFATIDGEKIYACCEDCAAKLTNDPAKYKSDIAKAYTYQMICPVMGKTIKATQFVPVGDERVYFCCRRCIRAFDNNPAKFAPKLEAQGFGNLAKAAIESD